MWRTCTCPFKVRKSKDHASSHDTGWEVCIDKNICTSYISVLWNVSVYIEDLKHFIFYYRLCCLPLREDLLFSYRYMIADFEYRIEFKIYNMTEDRVAHFSRRMTFELKILWTIIYATKIWLYYCFADWSFKLKLTRMRKKYP